jgi:hypothetical protein
MSPWQARLSLLAFALMASTVAANMLLFQHGRPATHAPARAVAATGAAHPAAVPPLRRPASDKREAQKPVSRAPAIATGSTGKTAQRAAGGERKPGAPIAGR